jgi:hypothetical protein
MRKGKGTRGEKRKRERGAGWRGSLQPACRGLCFPSFPLLLFAPSPSLLADYILIITKAYRGQADGLGPLEDELVQDLDRAVHLLLLALQDHLRELLAVLAAERKRIEKRDEKREREGF